MFAQLIKLILTQEKARGIINLVFVDDQAIRKLNKRFRRKNKVTDVLAFPIGEDGIIGELAIARPTVRKNARRYGVGYRQELKRMVIHGVLHLLGYRHGKEMTHAAQIYQKS